MAKLKIKKEQPRYKTQKQYESVFKKNYGQMLNAMNKEIILRLTENTEDGKQENQQS